MSTQSYRLRKITRKIRSKLLSVVISRGEIRGTEKAKTVTFYFPYQVWDCDDFSFQCTLWCILHVKNKMFFRRRETMWREEGVLSPKNLLASASSLCAVTQMRVCTSGSSAFTWALWVCRRKCVDTAVPWISPGAHLAIHFFDKPSLLVC